MLYAFAFEQRASGEWILFAAEEKDIPPRLPEHVAQMRWSYDPDKVALVVDRSVARAVRDKIGKMSALAATTWGARTVSDDTRAFVNIVHYGDKSCVTLGVQRLDVTVEGLRSWGTQKELMAYLWYAGRDVVGEFLALVAECARERLSSPPTKEVARENRRAIADTLQDVSNLLQDHALAIATHWMLEYEHQNIPHFEHPNACERLTQLVNQIIDDFCRRYGISRAP